MRMLATALTFTDDAGRVVKLPAGMGDLLAVADDVERLGSRIEPSADRAARVTRTQKHQLADIRWRVKQLAQSEDPAVAGIAQHALEPLERYGVLPVWPIDPYRTVARSAVQSSSSHIHDALLGQVHIGSGQALAELDDVALRLSSVPGAGAAQQLAVDAAAAIRTQRATTLDSMRAALREAQAGVAA